MSRPSLPHTIALFPLPGVLLLPGGETTLRAFEARYRRMFEACYDEEKMMGLIQPRPGRPLPRQGEPPLCSVGCLGQITDYQQTNEGHYLFSLKGLCRFRIESELPSDQGYRRAQVDYKPYRRDLRHSTAHYDLDKLKRLTHRYLSRRQRALENWELLARALETRHPDDFAMHLPFAPTEKQALLEAEHPDQRLRLMLSLLEMPANASPPEAELLN